MKAIEICKTIFSHSCYQVLSQTHRSFYGLLSLALAHYKIIQDSNYAKHLVKVRMVKIVQWYSALGAPRHPKQQYLSWTLNYDESQIFKDFSRTFENQSNSESLVSWVLRKVLIVHLDCGTCAGARHQSRTVGQHKTRVASSVFSQDYQIVGIN